MIVEGNRRVEADTIRSYFHPPLNAQIIDAAYKARYSTNLFQDVRISQAGGRLVVTVIENPVINKVAFEATTRLWTSNSPRKYSRSRAAETRLGHCARGLPSGARSCWRSTVAARQRPCVSPD